MKKIVLLATLSICNVMYSSHKLTYTEINSQRRRLPSASVIREALEKAGHHKAAQQDNLEKLANTVLPYRALETSFDRDDLFPREKDEAATTVFQIGTPVAAGKSNL